jgi:uncharacterized protein (DUF4415 family)
MPTEVDFKSRAHEDINRVLAAYLDAAAGRRDTSGMGERRDQKSQAKIPATIRFDLDVLTALIQASGREWQTRVNDALRESLRLTNPR